MLGLEKQIHVYSLDTACFYNQQEMSIHNKLIRLYYLRNKIKNKKIKDSLYTHQLNRIDKYINHNKNNLYVQFEQTRLYNIEHHGISRMEHSIKISYYSYLIAKKLKMDYVSVARGGLLHDFFLDACALSIISS